jgi:hypothetical protein
MSGRTTMPDFDPAMQHLALEYAREVRDKLAAKLGSVEDIHEREALVATYAMNSLLMVAYEIAYEYDIPVDVMVNTVQINYSNYVTFDPDDTPIH